MKIEQRGAVTMVWEEGLRTGWERWILLQSDQHYDSVTCNRELLKADLDEAKRRRAWIISVGDWFDAMQGRFDPRRSMAELRPEYRREDYYDFVVEDASEFLKPYAKNLVVIADGNHELAVLKNANTSLTDRLVGNLRKAGSAVAHGGFGGWVILRFNVGDTTISMSLRVKYFHGAGSEAPVTRGVIQTNRQAVYLPDADLVVNGHNHNAYYVPIARERVTDHGMQYTDLAHFIRTPGYKQDYADGSGGWTVTGGGVPKPIGCVWVKLKYIGGAGNGRNHNGRIEVSVTPEVRGPEPVTPAGDAYAGRVYAEDGEGA